MNTAIPIRNSARAILLNELNEVLLFKFDFSFLTDGGIVWVTPGGALEKGETFEDALKREVHEETGILLTNSFEPLWSLDKKFNVGTNKEFISHERYFLIKVKKTEIVMDNFTEEEKKTFLDVKWWGLHDLLDSDERFGPDNIREIVLQSLGSTE